MVRGAITRVVSAGAAFAVALALAFGAAPAPAQAAPKAAPPKPDAVQVAGNGIEKAVVIQQGEQPKLFQLLLSEVNWLASATSSTSAPGTAKLGPKYTLTIMVKNAPSQVYNLYPMAAGGPRAHRPAKQPSGKQAEGWFYGRLSMPEALRLAGAPLNAKPDIVHGGIGGGVGQDLTEAEASPAEEMSEAFTEFRRLFLLNGAVLLLIMTGLAGMAFLIRRRI